MARSITVIPAKQISTKEAQSSQQVRKLRMAAYCRVSTDQEEQLLSYENQVNYYTNYINSNSAYVLVKVYADEGISGTNTLTSATWTGRRTWASRACARQSSLTVRIIYR